MLSIENEEQQETAEEDGEERDVKGREMRGGGKWEVTATVGRDKWSRHFSAVSQKWRGLSVSGLRAL